MGRRNAAKMYVVSRQSSWPEGILYVELETGGEDCPSPGMLAGKGYGEDSFSDPRDAASNLIAVRNAWQKDDQEKILVSIGSTMGGLASHDPSDMTDDDINAWAEKECDRLPKCDECGEIRDETYTLDDGKFCSERCCEKAQARYEEDNLPHVIEHPDEWAWWRAESREWVEDIDDATTYLPCDVAEEEFLNNTVGEVKAIVRTLEDCKEDYKRECV